MEELAPGLRRWTAWHEEWEEEVGSLALETDEGLVLFDPLDPPGEVSRPQHVLLTVYWHNRSAKDLAGATVWASTRSAKPVENRGVRAVSGFRAGDPLPGGVQAVQTARSAEVVFWLPEQHALVVGDVLLGAEARPRPTSEPLRLCPERWLGKASQSDLRATLQPLLELPVELVLVSHGEPVLRDGRNELARVLSHA